MFRLRTPASIVALALTAAPCVANADIAIGLAAPLSGAFQPLGLQMKNGAEAAVADINAASGVLGQKLTLDEVDDACDAKRAIIAAGQLVASHVAFVAGHLCSGAAIATAPAYAAGGVVQISPGATAAAYTDERAGPGTFRVSARDDRQGTIAGAYLAKAFAGKRVAFVDDKTAYGRGLAKAALAEFNSAGQKETLAQAYDPDAKSYAALASVLQAANIDALFVGGTAKDAAHIAAALKEAGLAVTIVGGDTLASEDFFKTAAEASEGAMATALPDPRADPENAVLVARFRQRQIEPAGYALYAYAAVQVWAQAAAAAASADADKVSAAISSGTFKTALGSLTFDAKGDVTSPGYALYVWHNGNFAPLGP